MGAEVRFSEEETPLKAKGRELLDVAYRYWELYQKEIGCSAVIWIQGEDGQCLFFTRGEQAEHLKTCIHDF